MIVWVITPSGRFVAVALGVAGLLHLVRLVRWAGYRTLSDRLVLILHVAYAFVPAGFLLAALAAVDLVAPSAGIHAWTGGAIGSMTIAVMTRASLGHTGQALSASVATQFVYASIVIARWRGSARRSSRPFGPAVDRRGCGMGGGVSGLRTRLCAAAVRHASNTCPAAAARLSTRPAPRSVASPTTRPDSGDPFRGFVALGPQALGGPRAARRSCSRRSNGTGDVRSWAKDNGFQVSERGRIPSSVIEAYQAAH